MKLLSSALIISASWTALTGHAFAQSVETGGEARVELAFEDDANLTQARLEMLPEIEASWDSGARFFGSVRARLDLTDDLLPGSPEYPTYCGLCSPLNLGGGSTLELKDFYLEFESGRVLWKLGKQQIVWGQLDGFKLLDQVNPQSFEQFILEDFDRSRIGLWSARLESTVAGTDIQIVYAPDSTVSYVPDQDALFAFQAPRFRFGQAREASLELPQTTVRSSNIVKDATYALRLSRYVSGWDLAAVAITGLDHTPVGNLIVENGLAQFHRLHKRRSLVGASAATSSGPVVFRNEIGLYPNRSFNVTEGNSLGVVDRDQLTVAAALDYDGPGGLFLSVQFIYDRVLDAPRSLTRPDDDVLLSIFALKYFANETVKAEARLYAANGLFADALVSASLTYVASDALELSVGADLFMGDEGGIYGQFQDRDRVTFSMKRYF